MDSALSPPTLCFYLPQLVSAVFGNLSECIMKHHGTIDKVGVPSWRNESAMPALANGTAVRVRPLHGSGRECTGQLTVSPYPTGHKGAEGVFTGTIALDAATPGWVIGTQVGVEAAAATQ